MKHAARVLSLSTIFVLLSVFSAGAAEAPAPSRFANPTTTVFINEIHYDNTGTDAGEAIEIAGPAGTDLTGWSIVLYNGSNGAVYDTDVLAGSIPDQVDGYGTISLSYPVNGIQNGSPDGIALVDPLSAVVQFLSYEGTFAAVGGPAHGLTSTDIGVAEAGSELIGQSLQLSGTGLTYGDFEWTGPGASTFGAVNNGQAFGEPPPTATPTETPTEGPTATPTATPTEPPSEDVVPVINEFSASTAGTDVEYVEVFGQAGTDYSAYTLLEIEGDSGTTVGTIDEVVPVGTTDAGGFWLGNLAANALENGTISLLLVRDFTGALNADLDTDNDGVLDAMPWSAIADAVAVFDGGAGDRTYGIPALGPNYDGLSVFAPGGASRIPDGFDTDAASDWVRNDFDLAGIPGFAGTPVVGEALNTPGASNQVFVPPPEACGDPYTPIYVIQGSGAASPLAGMEVATEGLVVGDFQDVGAPDHGDLDGFYLQDPLGDDDPATSDGIFVFAPGSPDVAAGDVVRVRGEVAEFFELTELTGVTVVLPCGTTASVAPTAISLPVESLGDFEPYEGMLVTLPQPLFISEYFNFDRFGEIVLTTERQFQPTAVEDPGSAEASAVAAANALGRITLDDGRGDQNPDPAIHPNGNVFDLTNRFRGGDTVQDVTGVLDYRFGLYRVQPTEGAVYAAQNPRPAAPEDVGGRLTVASFNVLNYFTTLDLGPDICGPAADQECRGADDAGELARQRAKILAALATMEADVVGLIEIQNDDDTSVADLVAGLNDELGAGSYAYIPTGFIGSDAIKQALIYRTASVAPQGAYALLDSSVDSRFDDGRNRPALAQAFQDNETGGVFTVVVNHLKSKGSACGPGDDDPVQGNCNRTRTQAAQALVDWLATDPTGSGSPYVLIMGDLNAYDKEDPIAAILAGPDDAAGGGDDWTDLVDLYQGEFAYSYVFDGQLGYLDHGLASADMLSKVTGTTIWHINADEPDLLDYDTSFKQPAQDALYEPNAYRSSDHDPVVVGLDVCELTPPTLEVSLSPNSLWPVTHKYVDVTAIVDAFDDWDENPLITLVSVISNEPDEGLGDGDTPNDIVIVDDFHFRLRAERAGTGAGRVYTITYQATDACGNATQVSAVVTVPKSLGKN